VVSFEENIAVVTTMNLIANDRLMKCFSPLAGIFAGSLIGWALYFLSPDFEPAKITAGDIGARAYSLLFGLYGWGIAIVIGQQKNLHCGGTEDLKKDQGGRRVVFWIVSSVFLVIGALALAWGHLWLYAIIFALAIFGFLGEVGWGDPLRALNRLRNFYGTE